MHTRPAALPANLSQTAFLMGINRKPFISFPGGGSDSGRSIASSCYYGDPPGPHCLPLILPAIPSLPHIPDPCPCSLLSPNHSPVPAFSATQRGFGSLFTTDLRIGGREGAAGAAGAAGAVGLWGPSLTLLPLRIGQTAPVLSSSSDVLCHSSLG